MPRTYSVLLAGANPLLREKLAGVLTRNRAFWCVIQVDGRANLARAAAQTQPDIILADLSILKDTEMLRFLRRTSTDSRIIALVDSKVEPYIKAVREFGVDEIIECGRAGEELRSMIGALEKNSDNGA
jgi:DNA-binding NarL/FixJ family response regulator